MKPIQLSVWTPDSQADTGELPPFTRSFLAALRRAAPGSTLTVYAPGHVTETRSKDSEDDEAEQGEEHPGGASPVAGDDVEIRGVGKWPPFLRGPVFFLRILFDSIRRRPGLVVLTDVRFAPTAKLVKKILRIPFAVITHGREILDEPDSRPVRALEEADLVLADSTYSRDHLRDVLDLPTEKTGVLHAPFESEQFIPGAKPPYLLSRYGLGPEHQVILTLVHPGSTENAHACEHVIEALPRIRESLPDVHCLVSGTLREDEVEKITTILRYFHLEDCVTFTGSFPEEEACDHYNLADLVAMPSKGEGFTMSLLEAMACGTPVIAGDKDGGVDSLLEGSLGILVDPDSPDQICESVIKILSGSSDLPLLYRPHEMHKRVIVNFGADRFHENLAAHLDHLGLDLAAKPKAKDPDPADTPLARSA